MVDYIDCKKLFFCNNIIVVRHGHRCKEGNEAKNLGYVIYILVFLLKTFCFALALKCGYLHILGLEGMNVKAQCDILHLVKP